jgi:2-keto-4-pentenoate hydratase/2-oxohepta-3-ene-1,7-dioic acid hydratase in catechol pathway
MKWIHFSAPGAASAYGILEADDRIREIRGTPFGAHEPTGAVHKLAEVKIEVPLLPRTFYAAGLNYVKHIREYAQLTGNPLAEPKQADIGYRAVNALVAHDEAVVIPSDAKQIEYEGELVVVIGKQARHLSEADALSCVLGYTIGNDVSERLWQASDRTFWALQEHRHLQADGAVDRNRARPRRGRNDRAAQRRSADAFSDGRHVVRHPHFHQPHDALSHPLSGRRYLDGHRREIAPTEGR